MQAGDRYVDSDGELCVTEVRESSVSFSRKGVLGEFAVGREFAKSNWRLLSRAAATATKEQVAKQTEMVTLRMDKATYLDIRKKVTESGLSFNSWILDKLGYKVQFSQKPRGRRPSKFPEALGGQDEATKS